MMIKKLIIIFKKFGHLPKSKHSKFKQCVGWASKFHTKTETSCLSFEEESRDVIWCCSLSLPDDARFGAESNAAI